MRVDIGNALAQTATPGVPRDALERLDERVGDAHERIRRGRLTDEFGYTALDLPARVNPDAIRSAVEPYQGCDAVLTVGIGGSALGAATIAEALESDTDAYFLDNADPEYVQWLMDTLPLEQTAINVVSRSGKTAETMANFSVVRDAFERRDIDWKRRTFVTTGQDGHLRRLAEEHDLTAIDVPEGVPGRFSVLSPVGLACAALQGHDIEQFLEGARSADNLTGSLFDCPPYAYGGVAYALDRRDVRTNVMMPYAESMESFAEWFAQLWAESLGKDGVGQSPSRALGVTDQHSQLQLFRAGPRDKLVTFLRATDRSDQEIPPMDADGLEYLSDRSLGQLLDAELEATEASLTADDRPNVRIEVERLDEYGLGQLFFGLETACIMAGELYSVETFTQPDVEWAKEATRGILAEDPSADEIRTAEQPGLVVESSEEPSQQVDLVRSVSQD